MTDSEDIIIRQKRMDDAKLQKGGPPWRMWPDLAEGKLEKAIREGRVTVVDHSPPRRHLIKSKLKRRIRAVDL